LQGEVNYYDSASNAVVVAKGWVAKTGVELIPDLVLGKILGAGMQVKCRLLVACFRCTLHLWLLE
jgi:hypothetical protein